MRVCLCGAVAVDGGGSEAGVAAEEEDMATRAAVAAKVYPKEIFGRDA